MHDDAMTDLLERAVATARALPAAMQDDIARMVLRYAREDQTVFQLTPGEEASFAEARSQARCREFASDEQVRAAWAEHGLYHPAMSPVGQGGRRWDARCCARASASSRSGKDAWRRSMLPSPAASPTRRPGG